MRIIVPALVTFFHNLFTVIWMGGLIVSVLAYLPAVKEAAETGLQAKKVIAAFQRRQSRWVYLSIIGLILTGLMMSKRSPEFEGLLSFGNPYTAVLSLKHLLVLAMIAVTLYRALVLGKQSAGAGPVSPEKQRLNRQLLLINAALAVLVLLSSGFLTALSRPLVG